MLLEAAIDDGRNFHRIEWYLINPNHKYNLSRIWMHIDKNR